MTDEEMMKRVMDGIPDMPIKVQDKRFDKFKSFEEFAQSFAQSAQVIGIAQPEPVAYINVEERKLEWATPIKWETPTVVKMDKVPLYTKKEWVGLTEKETIDLALNAFALPEVSLETRLHLQFELVKAMNEPDSRLMIFAATIEAKLKEKNDY